MSATSALQFVTRASQDPTLYSQVTTATGTLQVTGISDEQFTAAAEVGRQAGYDFTPAELQDAYGEFVRANTAGQATMSDAEPADVVGYTSPKGSVLGGPVIGPVIGTEIGQGYGTPTGGDEP
jgi:hypothetical protein